MKKISPEFTKDLWTKIKSQKIPQTPAWVYPLREGAFWMSYVSSILFGGVFLAILYTFYQTLELQELFTPGMETELEFHSWMEALPATWGILFVVMTTLSILSFTKTANGYKFPKTWLIIFNVFLTIITASISLVTPILSDFITHASGKLEIEKELDRKYFKDNTITPDGTYELVTGIIVDIDREKRMIILEDENKKQREVSLIPELLSQIIQNADTSLWSYQEFIGENRSDGTFVALKSNQKNSKKDKKSSKKNNDRKSKAQSIEADTLQNSLNDAVEVEMESINP